MTMRTAFVGVLAAAICLPATAMAMASAELYSTNAYYYGRFDARIRFAQGDGVVSAFFLWKEGSEKSGAYWNELDLEKFSNCSLQTNIYYGNPAAQYSTKPSISDLCSGYHDYRIEWTPTYIAFLIDGNEVRRDTTHAPNFAQNASAGMTFHFNIWPGNQNFGGNIANTTLPVHQYISWVQYSSYENGNFTVQWREEFNGTTLPSGWAVGDWSSVYNLSTHTAQNVNFVNGVAVMSLTNDNATGYQGTPPVDPNAGTGGTPSTGGTTSVGGGATGTGGKSNAGGTSSAGGTNAAGGTTTVGGGATGTGGKSSAGGTSSVGGTNAVGGVAALGGSSAAVGGNTTAGGTPSTGGATVSAGTGGSYNATGGANATGGKSAATGGNQASTGGMTATATTGVGGTYSSGGSTGTGGSAPSSSTLGTSGSVSNSAADKSGSESGCGCSTGAKPNAFGASLLLLLLVGARRRRK